MGCDNSFDPRGSFLDRLVIYCVLTPLNQMHFVRLSSTYNPPQFDPLSNTFSQQVFDAKISIALDSIVYALRDSVIVRDDNQRYTDNLAVFVAGPLTLQRGKTYSLNIISPQYGSLNATTTIARPAVLDLDFESMATITDPSEVQSLILVRTFIPPEVEGHEVHMYVEYTSSLDSTVHTEEVPAVITEYRDCIDFDAEYPQMKSRTNGAELWQFDYMNYRRTLIKTMRLYPGVEIKRIYFVVTQADRSLYRYFKTVKGFQDPISIRLDQPNYSSIEGALGVFGSFTKDTLSISNFVKGFPGISITLELARCP